SDHAEAANRSKTIFLANMSHELRTPLNAILGFSAIIGADPGLSDQHRQDLAVVASSGEHLLGLIDDVLDMSKIETGGVQVEKTPLNLHALLNDVFMMMRQRARSKNLDLLSEISPGVPRFVRSDAGKLRQILVNLAGNAVSGPDEGSVAIRADATVGEGASKTVLIFDVEDTGIGIALQDLDRIFDPFVQAGRTRSRKGTGLGLSITRHSVQLL